MAKAKHSYITLKISICQLSGGRREATAQALISSRWGPCRVPIWQAEADASERVPFGELFVVPRLSRGGPHMIIYVAGALLMPLRGLT